LLSHDRGDLLDLPRVPGYDLADDEWQAVKVRQSDPCAVERTTVCYAVIEYLFNGSLRILLMA
jgi:hypothetical protein